jgi:hypothetical protein
LRLREETEGVADAQEGSNEVKLRRGAMVVGLMIMVGAANLRYSAVEHC